MASVNNQAVCAILWDLSALFDSILPHVLLSEAVAMGFQPRLLLVSVMIHLAPRIPESDGFHHITP
eukprot:11718716-Alexandrium_andersonii.AAC.1